MVRCEVCFRKCRLSEGQVGFCGGRVCRGGEVPALNYGKVTSVALDPIEKKPLNRFHPGSMILSVGSFGCDMRCPFCQNHSISWSQEAERFRGECDTLSPEQLAELRGAFYNFAELTPLFSCTSAGFMLHSASS